MNLENPELNEPFTARALQIMEKSSLCASMTLGHNRLNEADTIGIISRLTMIESRLLLFVSCLNDTGMEKAIADMNVADEIEFMDAADEFLKEISDVLGEY
jgi:hypothetical protein